MKRTLALILCIAMVLSLGLVAFADVVTSEPKTSDPKSSNPVSSEPASSDPASSEPASSEPASSDPASSEPASSDPQSSDPQSSDPQSSEVAGPFVDIAGNTFENEILWCYENGYMIGYRDSFFRPAQNISRAQIALVFYRLACGPVNPESSDPATSAPATSDPATSAPATSDPATSAPVSSDPVSSAPATSDPATSAPATSDPATSAPATSDPATSEPVSSEPAATDPSVIGYVDDAAIAADYFAAVKWAKETGVMIGYTDNTFRPNQAITREEFVTVFYRFLGAKAVSTELVGFEDAAAVKAPFVEAMCWAVENGIIKGFFDGKLMPQGNLTRGQMAAIVCRTFTLAPVVTSDVPVSSDPAASQPAASDPVVSDPVVSDPVVSDPSAT